MAFIEHTKFSAICQPAKLRVRNAALIGVRLQNGYVKINQRSGNSINPTLQHVVLFLCRASFKKMRVNRCGNSNKSKFIDACF